MKNWLQIISMILGEAEQILPIFIHNPKSQKIEAIVMTTAETAVAALATAPVPAPAATPAA
jgi:hypothetical protein